MIDYKVGDKVNRLTITDRVRRGKKNEWTWVCRCECGNDRDVFVTPSLLRRGVTKSCGCYARDSASARAKAMRDKGDRRLACLSCGTEFKSLSDKQVVCSTECRFKQYEGSSDIGCWNWTGPKNTDGYGVLFLNLNKENGRRMVTSSHRYAYEKYHGEIPEGMCVMHKCDNPACTNPDHLLLGTISENNKDRSKKGRSGSRIFTDDQRATYSKMTRGSANAVSKLTEEQAAEIKHNRSMTNLETALFYGISKSVVSHIRTNRSWKHV